LFNDVQFRAIADNVESNNLCVIVLLNCKPYSEQRSIMTNIFGYFLLQRYNINVIILVPSLQGVRAFNVLPYTPTSCGSIEPVELDLKNAELWDVYPTRLKNLHGCPLSVIVWDIPPYMKVHWERNDSTQMLDGLDGKLMSILAWKTFPGN